MNISDFVAEFDPMFIQAIVSMVLFVAIVMSMALVDNLRRNEKIKRHIGAFNLVAEFAASFVFEVAYGSVDLSPFELRSAELVAMGYDYYDPRLLYVVDKIEDRADAYGLNLDIVEAAALAERVYRKLKNSGELLPSGYVVPEINIEVDANTNEG